MDNPLKPSYCHDNTGAEEDRIDHFPSSIRPFSEEEAAVKFRESKEDESSTCFVSISRQLKRPPKDFDWSPLLSNPPLVALSGGLDSFLIAALIKEKTGSFPPVATLVSGLENYCEAEFTIEFARQLGMKDVIRVEANEEEFVASLPEAIKAAEVPLYNLHPVSKWIFARKTKALGFKQCLTGDGADQICSHHTGIDYLPIVGSMFSAAGIELICPFYNLELQPAIPDKNKTNLRRIAARLLPENFTNRPKKSCYTPPMDLSRYLKTPLAWPDQAKTLAVTIELLKQSHQ